MSSQKLDSQWQERCRTVVRATKYLKCRQPVTGKIQNCRQSNQVFGKLTASDRNVSALSSEQSTIGCREHCAIRPSLHNSLRHDQAFGTKMYVMRFGLCRIILYGTIWPAVHSCILCNLAFSESFYNMARFGLWCTNVVKSMHDSSVDPELALAIMLGQRIREAHNILLSALRSRCDAYAAGWPQKARAEDDCALLLYKIRSAGFQTM